MAAAKAELVIILLRLFFNIIFIRMRLSQTYKKTLLSLVEETFAVQQRGRPRTLDPRDAVDSHFRLIRTGMQWRELTP